MRIERRDILGVKLKQKTPAKTVDEKNGTPQVPGRKIRGKDGCTPQTDAWDAKAAQRGEEQPLKIHDHGPDAFRYFAKSEVSYWRLTGS
jgi:hypothetical protein